jgi:putative flippase GtrA
VTATAMVPGSQRSVGRHLVLDVVIPVHNEEKALIRSVETVRAHLRTLPFDHRVTIADNASTDATSRLAHQLARRFDDVEVVSLTRKGRGRALKEAWSRSDADVLVYMDVDLSTDLNALLPLVAPLLSGHSDLAIGSRLARTSRTTRGPRREVISRAYNVLLRGALRARFSDAQCGFKAIRRDVASLLLPLIEDDEWFFDTELLIVAERAGLRIHEVPVDWVDDPDSRVDIVRTAVADLQGIGRLGWALVRGRIPLAEVSQALGRATAHSAGGRLSAQMVVFALVGALSTAAYGVLYVLLRGRLGAQEANAIALALTAVANTAANRRFTFGLRGPAGALRHQLQGLLVFAAGLAVTSGTLWAMRAIQGAGHPLVEVAVLTAANLFVTVMRFVVMRVWIFRRTPPDDRLSGPAPCSKIDGDGTTPTAD